MIFSTVSAVFIFCGKGIPWEMIVDSNATIGSPVFNACWTSVEISISISLFKIPL
jgi:hypothetical protein